MTIRTAICTAAGLFAVLFLLAFTPKSVYSPHGMVLPAKTVRAAISPSDVTIYQQAPSGPVERLGLVRAEFAFHDLNEQTRDTLLAKVKSLAASVGANGVVVNMMGSSDGLRKIVSFVGTAIYTPSSSTGAKS